MPPLGEWDLLRVSHTVKGTSSKVRENATQAEPGSAEFVEVVGGPAEKETR